MDILLSMIPTSGMTLALIVGIVVAVMILWNVQRDQSNKIELMDLVCVDGQINSNKFMRFTAFVVSTWGFVYLIVDQRFSEWYFAGYMTTWTGSALLSKWIDSKNNTSINPPPPPPPR